MVKFIIILILSYLLSYTINSLVLEYYSYDCYNAFTQDIYNWIHLNMIICKISILFLKFYSFSQNICG